MNANEMPKEGEINNFLENRLHDNLEPIKHFWAILYYMEKEKSLDRKDIKKLRQEAKGKAIDEFDDVSTETTIDAAISGSRGFNMDQRKEFDPLYLKNGLKGVLTKYFKRKELDDNDKKIFKLLYKISSESDENNSKERNAWAITPGENGKYWDEFRKEEIIAIGWSKLGPLSNYQSKDEIEQEIKNKYPSDEETEPENKARSCYYFANDIKKGDIIISKNGSSRELFGIGIVKKNNPYNYVKERDYYKNTIEVNWIIEMPQDHPLGLDNLDKQFDYKVVYNYNYLDEVISEIIKKHPEYEDDLKQYMTKPIEIDFENPNLGGLSEGLFFPESYYESIKKRIKTSLENGKHLILIGPPGTGKSKLAKNICKSYRISNKKWKMSTATSDWTTFDTIGGYRMKSDQSLEFTPGIFLDCFQDNDNIWLIIDEINRADIDKAFGSLFSALTGDDIELPYEIDGENINLIGTPSDKKDKTRSPTNYIIPKKWRIIATMNTFDKASLYEMSYAFMRRFAFIEVNIPKNEDIDSELIERYIDCWDNVDKKEDKIIKDITLMWKHINETRRIGPALIKDIYSYLLSNPKDYEGALIQYVYPQFEGISKTKQKDFIENICEDIENLDEEILIDFVEDFFRIDLGLDTAEIL